eukprot:NODE_25690_length_578_cov_2.920177.p2 GENE.NODE_25690_length_578_cov_2.920177~~NODE_25690_length_578_cov_2.920177.p2  ORF type:complete len:91 (-),score=32.59 NODE_25690_length_578_cov_2.920177:46-318(-)
MSLAVSPDATQRKHVKTRQGERGSGAGARATPRVSCLRITSARCGKKKKKKKKKNNLKKKKTNHKKKKKKEKKRKKNVKKKETNYITNHK